MTLHVDFLSDRGSNLELVRDALTIVEPTVGTTCTCCGGVVLDQVVRVLHVGSIEMDRSALKFCFVGTDVYEEGSIVIIHILNLGSEPSVPICIVIIVERTIVLLPTPWVSDA